MEEKILADKIKIWEILSKWELWKDLELKTNCN